MSKQKKTLSERVRFTNKVINTGLKSVSQHHIEAYDYGIQTCLPRIVEYMLPVEVTQVQNAPQPERAWPFKKYKMWIENVEIRRPQRANANS